MKINEKKTKLMCTYVSLLLDDQQVDQVFRELWMSDNGYMTKGI